MKGQYLFTLRLVAILSYFTGEIGLNSRSQTLEVNVQKITWIFFIFLTMRKIEHEKIPLQFQTERI